MFIYSPAYIKTIHNSMSNYKKLQKLILMEIEKLITSSESVEHRKTGGYYTLIALVEASPIYAVYFPWLVQSIWFIISYTFYYFFFIFCIVIFWLYYLINCISFLSII